MDQFLHLFWSHSNLNDTRQIRFIHIVYGDIIFFAGLSGDITNDWLAFPLDCTIVSIVVSIVVFSEENS